MKRQMHPHLEADLRAAGFSGRAASVISRLRNIRSLQDLRNAEWGDGKPHSGGLYRELLVTPNCGQRVISEVVAFREHGDPRRLLSDRPPAVTVQFSSDELAAIDAWIADQGEPVTRSKAVRALALLGLSSRGAG